MSKNMSLFLSVRFRFRLSGWRFKLRPEHVAKWLIPGLVAVIKLVVAYYRHSRGP